MAADPNRKLGAGMLAGMMTRGLDEAARALTADATVAVHGPLYGAAAPSHEAGSVSLHERFRQQAEADRGAGRPEPSPERDHGRDGP